MAASDVTSADARYRAALDRVRDRSPLLAATIDRHVSALTRRLDEQRHDEPPAGFESGAAGAGEPLPGTTS